MSPQEIQASTSQKIKQIEALMAELKITVSAEEVLLQSGIIKKVVYYFDNENYPKKDESTIPKENVVEEAVQTPDESSF